MIYSIKIIIEIDSKKIKNNYYNVLGSILNILGNDPLIKESILSISNIHGFSQDLSNINISINGKENFNIIVSKIQNEKKINFNGEIYKIKGIDFNFDIFDDNTKFIDFKQIEIFFKTPTIIKKEMNGIDINQLLPIPEIFLLSVVRKYNNLYSKNYNLENVKDYIKKNVFVVKFDIKTKTILIKKNIKAGVVGKIKYEFLSSNDNEIKKIIYNALKLASLIGIGTGVRLGLGQMGVYFVNK